MADMAMTLTDGVLTMPSNIQDTAVKSEPMEIIEENVTVSANFFFTSQPLSRKPGYQKIGEYGLIGMYRP